MTAQRTLTVCCGTSSRFWVKASSEKGWWSHGAGVWSGVISFGLVSVPVGVFTATEEHEPSFHQFAEGSTDRIRYKRVNERTGDEVDYGDIVKGVKVGGAKYVMVTDEELEQVAPGRSRSLEISGFVDLDDIDPIYFNKAYYLAPAKEENKKPSLCCVTQWPTPIELELPRLSCTASNISLPFAPRVTRWFWRHCFSPMRSAMQKRMLDNLPGAEVQ